MNVQQITEDVVIQHIRFVQTQLEVIVVLVEPVSMEQLLPVMV